MRTTRPPSYAHAGKVEKVSMPCNRSATNAFGRRVNIPEDAPCRGETRVE